MHTKTITVLKCIIPLLLCKIVAGQEHFPNNPKPCKFEDYECIKSRINYFIQQKGTTGDSAINLAILDPLYVAKMNVKQGLDSPVSIDLTFTDNNLIGIKTMEITKVKGFGKDLTKNHQVHGKALLVSLVGDYSINGKVLILPISGSGKNNLTLEGCELSISFYGEPVEKDGETFMKATKLKTHLRPKRLHFHFSNLFNGDKTLGDTMNDFLNENWESMYAEVQGSIENAFAKLYERLLTDIFSKYPYEKFFAE